MEKLLEKMVEGKINNKNVDEIRYNSKVLWSKYYVEYSIDVDDGIDEPVNTLTIDNHYKYLPVIDDYGLNSHNYYEYTKIILKNGDIVNDLSTPVNNIERIIIYYSTDTSKIRFSGTTDEFHRIKDLYFINTTYFTSMKQMFYYSKLNSLDLSYWDTSNVTDMSGMFYGCTSLTSLDLSGFNTGKVTDMSHMFQYCSALSSLVGIDNFNVRNVTDMTSMFYDCSSLVTLDIYGAWIAEKVTSMAYMFCGCTSLQDIVGIGYLRTGSVTNMKQMFKDCKSLSKLNLYSGYSIGNSIWDTSKVTNMSDMFYGCTSLTSLELEHWNTGRVSSKSNMFYNIPSSCKIYVTDEFTLTESQTGFKGTFIR